MLIPLGDHAPNVHQSAWVAPSADLVGNVELRADSSVWYTAVLRAELEPIVLGERSNLQDGVIVHTDVGKPATIGAGVSVGHRAVLHGCTLHENVLVGIGAIILDGAVIGANSIIGAGTVITSKIEIPAGKLVWGVPAEIQGDASPKALEAKRRGTALYQTLPDRYRKSLRRID